MRDSQRTVPFRSHIAALHGALWGIDRGYRLWWYVWPASMAMLICGWIYLDKPMNMAASTSAPWGKPAASPGAAGKPPPTQVIVDFPEKLRDDAQRCYGNTPDKNPLIEACSRVIGSRLLNDEQRVAAHNQRGLHYHSTKQRDLAISDYDAALKIGPDTPAVLINRSLFYMESGQNDAALTDLNKAIQLLAPALSARARLHRVAVFIALKDYDKAIADLDESQRLDPTDSEGYLARAVIESRRQRYDAALQAYDEFGKRSPPHIVIALIGRALTLEAAGRPAEALLSYENALKVEPTNSQAISARDRLRRAGSR